MGGASLDQQLDWIGAELVLTLSFRGRRSRNKVSVGEPAEGSFMRIIILLLLYFTRTDILVWNLFISN